MASAIKHQSSPMLAVSSSDGPVPKDIQTRPSAAEQVFTTIELMEMILLELPMRTLFTIQATNKTFQENIKSSQKLGRKTFLVSALMPATGQPSVTLNPFLHATMLLPGEHDAHNAFDPVWQSREVAPSKYSAQTHAWRLVPSIAFQRLTLHGQDPFLSVSHPTEEGNAMSRRPGSWRQMLAVLVQREPAIEVVVKFEGDMKPGMAFGVSEVPFDQGLTLGELHDWVQQLL